MKSSEHNFRKIRDTQQILIWRHKFMYSLRIRGQINYALQPENIILWGNILNAWTKTFSPENAQVYGKENFPYEVT